MKQQVAAVIVTVALVGGAGTGWAVRDARTDADAPVAKPTPSATTTSAEPSDDADEPDADPAPQQPAPEPEPEPEPEEPVLLPPSSLQIGTGTIGPVSVGMTTVAAAETGYFDTDVDACALQWKPDYATVLDVATDGGAVTSLGVEAAGPRTVSGLSVGSTYASVRGVVGEDVVPEPAGSGQTGLFVTDGAGWIGFLFDAAPDAVTDESTVTFIEVTRGARPDLVRGGC